MVTSARHKITRPEADLLDDIASLGFGEIYEVELISGQPTIDRVLTSQQDALVKLIRTGMVSFPLIKVHQGLPTYAETIGVTPHGWKCKKLHKFI